MTSKTNCGYGEGSFKFNVFETLVVNILSTVFLFLTIDILYI